MEFDFLNAWDDPNVDPKELEKSLDDIDKTIDENIPEVLNLLQKVISKLMNTPALRSKEKYQGIIDYAQQLSDLKGKVHIDFQFNLGVAVADARENKPDNMKSASDIAYIEGVRAGLSAKGLDGNRTLNEFLALTEKIDPEDTVWEGEIGNCEHWFDVQTFNEMLGQTSRGDQELFEKDLAYLDAVNANSKTLLDMFRHYMQQMIDSGNFKLETEC